MNKLYIALSFIGAALIAPAVLHATPVPLDGHFSVTGTFLANDVATAANGGNGTSTLLFSNIASGVNTPAITTSTGSFGTILQSFETSPSHGTIPYTLGGNTTYPNLFVEFVNTSDPSLDLFVQILNLNSSRCCLDTGTGGYIYSYVGNVNFFVGSLDGMGNFTANPTYATTAGTVQFSSQDERVGAVTFSGTAGVPATTPTPEPSSIALLGTAVLAGAGMMRKRLLA